MRTDVFHLTLLLWSFSLGWHGQWKAPLHRASVGPLEAHPALHISESHRLPSAFFSRSCELPALLSTGLLLHSARGPRNHLDHLSLVTAKLLLHLWWYHAYKFPYAEHLSLANVSGNHQKCSKRSDDPNSAQGWARTAPLRLQSGATGTGAESKELPNGCCVTAIPAPSWHLCVCIFFRGIPALSTSSYLIY